MNAHRRTRAPRRGWARARAPGQRRPALEVFPEHRVPTRRALRRPRRSVPPARSSRPGKRISAALWLLARFSAMDRSAPEFGRVAKCDRRHNSQSCDRIPDTRAKCPFCPKRAKCNFRAKCPKPRLEAIYPKCPIYTKCPICRFCPICAPRGTARGQREKILQQ